jgi:hypothetical protein
MFEEGDRLAEKYAPNDPVIKDYVRQRIQTSVAQTRAAKRDYDNTNKLLVHGTIMAPMPGGKLRTTLEEITIDSRVKRAYEALDPEAQKAVISSLAKNVKQGLVVEKTPEMLAEYRRLHGMANSDPAKFMDQDFPNMNLPTEWKQEFIKLQEKKMQNADSDPRVGHALNILRPMLGAAKLNRRDNEEGYDQFVGSLQYAINTFQADNKKLPKDEDINRIGQQLLRQSPWQWGSPSGWPVFGGAKKPFYQTPVPATEAEKIRNRPTWSQMGLKPDQVTDEMVRRIYINTEYKKLFAKPPASKPPSGPQVPRQ